jgi:hypothetical protein
MRNNPPRAHRGRAVAFAAGILLAIAALSELILGSRATLGWIDERAPDHTSTSLLVHIEKQVLHMEANAPRRDGRRVVIFMGSSSVVNGVDVGAVRARWRRCGLDWDARNFGATDLRAYELPMLSRFWKSRDAQVVYLYNAFSFGDDVKRDALALRWGTAEAMGLLGAGRLWDVRDEAAAGIAGEGLALIRYGDLYREVAWRALTGRLRRVASRYDYGGADEREFVAEARAPSALPALDPLRKAYLDSESARDTLGWRGLRRFLAIANEAAQPVMLGPVPEPDFALQASPYRAGTHPQRVRESVARTARAYAVPVLDAARDIERDARLFRDPVHLNAQGRGVYSASLAIDVARNGRGPFAAAPAALECLAGSRL